MTVWTPRPWQWSMFDHIVSHPRCALWARMGLGKTSVVLAAHEALRFAGVQQKTLVIGPLRVARDVWPDEVKKWENFSHLKVQPIVGSLEERCEALRNDKADIYTTNYEVLPWLIDRIGPDHWPFGHVVPDEARRLKNFRVQQGGTRAGKLAEVIFKRVKYVTELTGAPAANGLKDLWGQMWFLDRGHRLGNSFSAFEERWFAYKRVQDAANPGKTFIQTVIMPWADAEIHGLVKDLCLTVDPKDWFKGRDPIQTNVTVKLPESARKHYREMENKFFTEIQGHEIEAFSAATKSMKCLQLANGAAYIDEDATEWRVVHDEKLKALQSIVEEAAGEAVIVAYHFKSDRARLMKAFPKAVDLATQGGMAAFKAGQAQVGIGHPASMGHGVDGLQNVCNIGVFFGHWWDMDQREQFIERIGPTRQMQAGLDRPTYIYNIVAEGTLDADVLARHRDKTTVQDALLAATKRRVR